MSLSACVMLLAQLPETHVYISAWKLLLAAAIFTIWALFAQWVDKDTVAVNTFRVLWNLVLMAGGVVTLAILMLVPLAAISLPAGLVVVAVSAGAYILHRNGLVRPEDKVFTPAHIQRKLRELFQGKKKKVVEVKERVLIKGADGRRIAIPTDELEREQYRLTQDLVFDAMWRRAAVVQVLPAGQATKLGYLIDGVPTERQPVTRPEGEAIVRFLKSTAGLDLEERRKPQKGSISVGIGENKVEVVVETKGTTAGEHLALRVLGDETHFKVRDVGLTESQFATAQEIMKLPRGVILVSSPPAEGLTTTLFSFVRSHDAFLQNIQTLEYRHDLKVDNITQRIFEPGEEKTFASELQRLLRSDPDIVVLPEVREQAAAVIASQGAAEKQKIYVGISGPTDVFDALKRWIGLVRDPALVAKSLNLVINQRLVRKLCTQCREQYKPDPGMLRKLNMPPDTVLHRVPEPQYDKHGNPIICQNCQGVGYFGRTAVLEMLVLDDELRPVIQRAKSLTEIQNAAAKRGGLGLQRQALQKVLDGTTSIQEVIRVTRGGKHAAAGGASPPAAPAPSPAKPRPKPTSGGGAAAQPAR